MALMGLHFAQAEGVVVAAAGVGGADFGGIGVEGVVGGVVGAAGDGAEETASFGVPTVMAVLCELQGSPVIPTQNN
ncbi:MAG: hypothetical protein ACRCXC_09720 [Legionella sp.]